MNVVRLFLMPKRERDELTLQPDGEDKGEEVCKYECGCPGCNKRYLHTDGVRKHARKMHPHWLYLVDTDYDDLTPGEQKERYPTKPDKYCSMVMVMVVAKRLKVGASATAHEAIPCATKIRVQMDLDCFDFADGLPSSHHTDTRASVSRARLERGLGLETELGPELWLEPGLVPELGPELWLEPELGPELVSELVSELGLGLEPGLEPGPEPGPELERELELEPELGQLLLELIPDLKDSIDGRSGT